MKKFLLTLMGISALALTGILFPLHPENSFAETNHIVISEIQNGKTSASYDEFIELYNPTSNNIDITNWKLVKKSKTGSVTENLISSFSGIIKSHGYLLIASDKYSGSITSDFSYTASTNVSISADNSIILYDNLNSEVDMLGFDDSTTSETTTINSPAVNKSVERKANSLSTSMSMNIGGLDEFLGNGEDTDNNSIDFVTRSVPQPQNSASEIEPTLVSPTPTLEPTAEPTPTVTPTNEPIPTPTIEPSPTPTSEPSPTPIPTEEPSVTPTLSPIPTPTIIPTITPTPTKGPKIFSSNPIMTCHINYKSIKVFRKTFYFPLVACFRTLR